MYGHNTGDTSDPTFDLKDIYKAFMDSFQKLNLRMDNLEDNLRSSKGKSIQRDDDTHDPSYDEENEAQSAPVRARRFNDRVPYVDNSMNSIKMKIPSFNGKADVDAYLEWERKVEMVFNCQNYSDDKKVKLAALEFSDYALIWWDELVKSRRRNRELPIASWDEMKRIMRKKYVPTYYHRDLHHQLQRLIQGSKSVDEYYKEMELLLIKANIVEEEDQTMARFFGGLNKEIADVVDLQPYVDLEDLVNIAIKVERQRGRNRWGSNSAAQNSNSKWGSKWNTKPDPKRFEKSSTQKGMLPSKETSNSHGKNESAPKSNRTRDIQCFKCKGRGHYANECANKRAMIVRGDEIVSESDSDSDEVPPLEDCSDVEIEEYPVQGESLVILRTLNVSIKEEGLEQRENIFHTRCLVGGKVCSMIIDSGSQVNCASTILVDKLGLETIKHPNPYRLQWLNDSGEAKVTKQCKVSFSIGKYVDEVTCDIVPMQAGHILLGRPWQFDRRVIHDGYSNRFSFTFLGVKHILVPLSPKDVYADQVKLQQSAKLGKGGETSKKMREKRPAVK